MFAKVLENIVSDLVIGYGCFLCFYYNCHFAVFIIKVFEATFGPRPILMELVLAVGQTMMRANCLFEEQTTLFNCQINFIILSQHFDTAHHQNAIGPMAFDGFFQNKSYRFFVIKNISYRF